MAYTMHEKQILQLLYKDLPRTPSMESDLRQSRFSAVLETANGERPGSVYQHFDDPLQLQEENK